MQTPMPPAWSTLTIVISEKEAGASSNDACYHNIERGLSCVLSRAAGSANHDCATSHLGPLLLAAWIDRLTLVDSAVFRSGSLCNVFACCELIRTRQYMAILCRRPHIQRQIWPCLIGTPPHGWLGLLGPGILVNSPIQPCYSLM